MALKIKHRLCLHGVFFLRKGNALALHGGENGFLPNALLVFKSNRKAGDDHNNMTKWVTQKLIENLPPTSVFEPSDTSYNALFRIVLHLLT
jgi:hypothetical protein